LAAASGAIAGAVLILGERAIIDVSTALIALVGLGLIVRYRVQEPYLVAAAGLAGLLLHPLASP
jgi:chromate transporter